MPSFLQRTIKRPEQELQKSIIRWVRIACPEALCFAIPNGGYRSKIEAAIFKSIGVLAGVSDLMIIWSPARFGFIELKAANNGLTEAQGEFCSRLDRYAALHAVVRSLDEFRDLIRRWQVPCREVFL